MSNWIVEGIAKILARTMVINPMCNALLEELQTAKHDLDVHQAHTARIIEAGLDLHSFMRRLGAEEGVISFKVDEDVAGAELYELAAWERIEAFRCAVTGEFFEPTIDSTDLLDGETLWAVRRTNQSLN